MENSRKCPHLVEKETTMVSEKWSNNNNMKSVRVLSSDGTLVQRVGTKYHQAADAIYNFKVRPDDIWVVTFPRSGTTLMQEMVWLIINDDYETAQKEPRIKRFPYLEMNTMLPDDILKRARGNLQDDENKLNDFDAILCDQWVALETKTDRRFIKSHLRFSMLPPELLTSGCKVIYVARNPKDVAVSSFKFFCQDSSDEDFPEFYKLFRNDCLPFTPYWNHVKEGWKNRGTDNYLFMFYEDVIKDMKTAIQNVSNFLEKDMTDKQVEKLAEHLNINNFRSNKSVTRSYGYYLRASDDNQIVRKGGEGGWRNFFTDALNSDANEWIKENYKETDLRFPVELEY